MSDTKKPDTLADMMVAEGVHQVRYYRSGDLFTVQLFNGISGQGKTVRAAIHNAKEREQAA